LAETLAMTREGMATHATSGANRRAMKGLVMIALLAWPTNGKAR